MQIWAKTKIQYLVRNSQSGVYYARARVNGKLHWKSLATDSISVAKARLPKTLAQMGRGYSKPGAAMLTFGDAAQAHLANTDARVDIKPATKHYWHQIVDALLASWPELATRKLTQITESDARFWAASYQAQVSPTRYNNAVDCCRAIFDLVVLLRCFVWVVGVS